MTQAVVLYWVAAYAVGAALTAFIMYDTADLEEHRRKRHRAPLHKRVLFVTLLWFVAMPLMLVTNLVKQHARTGVGDRKRERDRPAS